MIIHNRIPKIRNDCEQGDHKELPLQKRYCADNVIVETGSKRSMNTSFNIQIQFKHEQTDIIVDAMVTSVINISIQPANEKRQALPLNLLNN